MNDPDWRSLIEGMLEGVWVLDPLTLHILGLNAAAASMLDEAATRSSSPLR